MDKNLNELCTYQLERYNEICYNFCILSSPEESNLKTSNSIIFALGTAIVDENFREPEKGNLTILEFTEKLKFNKICEIETRGGIYKLASMNNILYASIASCFYAYKLISVFHDVNKDKEKMLIDSGNNKTNANTKDKNLLNLDIDKDMDINSNENFKKKNKNENFSLELIKKINDFFFIYDFICFDEFILISDMCRSVSLWRFDKNKENILEMTRDFNPITCNALVKSVDDIITISDLNNNLYNLSFDKNPKSDEDRFM